MGWQHITGPDSNRPDVRCWHFSEVAALTFDVRYWGKIGIRGYEC